MKKGKQKQKTHKENEENMQFPAWLLRVESPEKKGEGEIAQLPKSIDPVEILGDEKLKSGFVFPICTCGDQKRRREEGRWR